MGSRLTTAFLCGDVMTGRGIDQILGHPSAPRLYEPYVRDAREYVALAEEVSGPIPLGVLPEYVWGDALPELERVQPDLRIVNLETSVTRWDEPWPGKGINYRMHPANVTCLAAARIDVAALANNHVLDWERPGLDETLGVLSRTGIRGVGAGHDAAGAQAPAVIDRGTACRWFVFGWGATSSGIPPEWGATPDRSGVALLPDLTRATARRIGEQVRAVKRTRNVVVLSLHWGSNWGYGVPDQHVRFAHELIDEGVDVVHGHSSHHPRPIEVYRNKLILYGCGDFINDYEGIAGHEAYRGDLALMYFVTLDPEPGELVRLRMVPLQVRKFRLQRASPKDAVWLRDQIGSANADFGTIVTAEADGSLTLRW